MEQEPQSIVAPEGAQAPTPELSRARLTAQFLEALLPTLVDDAEAAQALFDLAALRSYPLDDAKGALEALRAALARRPALHIARAYRKAAVLADSIDDQLAAHRERNQAGADAGSIAPRSRPSAAGCTSAAVGNRRRRGRATRPRSR